MRIKYRLRRLIVRQLKVHSKEVNQRSKLRKKKNVLNQPGDCNSVLLDTLPLLEVAQ